MSVSSTIQEQFEFSDYQMAQLRYFWKSMLNEVSKIALMAVFFHKELPLFFFTVVIMLFLRTASSGIHFEHYLSCFAFSFAYLFVLLRICSTITPSKIIQLLCLLVCVGLIYLIGPVPAKVHRKLDEAFIRKMRLRAVIIAALYACVCLLAPASAYTTVTFWIVVLHALQLIIAKLIQKGGERNERKN